MDNFCSSSFRKWRLMINVGLPHLRFKFTNLQSRRREIHSEIREDAENCKQTKQ